MKYYQKNQDDKKEVERIINNERMNLKCQDAGSGNAWKIAENLRENITKTNHEIGLYENLKKPKLRF